MVDAPRLFLVELQVNAGCLDRANSRRNAQQQCAAALGGWGMDAQADGGGEAVLTKLAGQGLAGIGSGVAEDAIQHLRQGMLVRAFRVTRSELRLPSWAEHHL